jgi:LPXTG-motif cell wall-anchored protein
MRALKVFLMVAVVVALVAPASIANAQRTNWVKIDCGTVVKAMGNTVVIRLDSTNKTKVFKNVSPDIHFTVNNKEATVYELKKGMKICGYKEADAPAPVIVTIEAHEVAAVVDTPDKHDAPPPAPKAAPAPAPAPAVLPHTASSLPLAALAGLMLLALSAGIAVLRRF